MSTAIIIFCLDLIYEVLLLIIFAYVVEPIQAPSSVSLQCAFSDMPVCLHYPVLLRGMALYVDVDIFLDMPRVDKQMINMVKFHSTVTFLRYDVEKVFP